MPVFLTRFFIPLFCIVVLAAGCKHDSEDMDPLVPDHREQYYGQWQFEVTKASSDYNNPGASTSNTSTHVGAISAGEKPNEIVIEYEDLTVLSASVNTEGELSNLREPGSCNCSGDFHGSSSLKIYMQLGSLAYSRSTSISGEKL